MYHNQTAWCFGLHLLTIPTTAAAADDEGDGDVDEMESVQLVIIRVGSMRVPALSY
jgi:hypothetical protein